MFCRHTVDSVLFLDFQGLFCLSALIEKCNRTSFLSILRDMIKKYFSMVKVCYTKGVPYRSWIFIYERKGGGTFEKQFVHIKISLESVSG